VQTVVESLVLSAIAIEAAVLPQSLQDQLPCKNSQGLCAHEKVVWLVSSRGDVDELADAADLAS
jgi:hypothetical protein